MVKSCGARVAGLLVLFGTLVLLDSGCAGLFFVRRPVEFEDPYTRLGIVHVEPVPEEQSGVTLRLLPPERGFLRAHEETTVYAKVKDGRGIHFTLIADRDERFWPGSREDSYELLSQAGFVNTEGGLLEEFEQTERGEILRFLRGHHHSKVGKFTILNWTRTPVYPEEAVKIGDAWEYEEVMSVRLDSFWLKEIEPQPYRIQAESRHTGFALVKEKRAAVIETRSVQTKREHFRILFREFLFDIHTEIVETTFLDYSTGIVLARITRSESHTQGLNIPMSDRGLSQSVYEAEV